MRAPLAAIMSWGLPIVCIEITLQALSHICKHRTSDKKYWVKIMKRPLTATLTWGLPNIRDYTLSTESHRRALNIRQKVLGEYGENIADSYHGLGVSQCMLTDYMSATESHKRVLNTRQKVLAEDHENTSDSYFNLGITQHMLRD